MDDLRIEAYDPLLPPHYLAQQCPLSDTSKHTIALARAEAGRIVHGEDDRVVAIVGPCSIHDVPAALEYGMY